MKVGFHSPLPPVRTGVADYASALLASSGNMARFRSNSAKSADIEFYHLGNNQLHRSIYRRACSVPEVLSSMTHYSTISFWAAWTRMPMSRSSSITTAMGLANWRIASG